MKYLAILLASLSLGVPTHALIPSSDAYFPMEKGFSWVYDTTKKTKKEPEHFDMKVVMEDAWSEKKELKTDPKLKAPVVQEEPLGKGLSGMIMTQKDKRGKMREFLLRDDMGIYIYKLGLSKGYTPEVFTHFTPAVPKVIYPLEPGTKVHWEGGLKVAWVDKHIIFDGEVVGFEDIQVPAGTFHCIKLHFHEKRDDEVLDEYYWYAEGVGQVKSDTGQYVKELKSYSAAK